MQQQTALNSNNITFDELINEAKTHAVIGWDFSFIHNRWSEHNTKWDFSSLVRHEFMTATRFLDLGTGGGEFLSSLVPLPEETVATEAFEPNIDIAQKYLSQLNVKVVGVAGAPDNIEIESGQGIGNLPFSNNYFSLITSRYESYYPDEIYRILKHGGIFLTQQVGYSHYDKLNQIFDNQELSNRNQNKWNQAFAIDQLKLAGFNILEHGEEYPETVFNDVGALVYYLRMVPWQIPDFNVDKYQNQLKYIHEQIKREGGLVVTGHYFYIRAVKL
ncbi:unnamed protein product [Rotaria sp. Silwood1]|nr:unnamed protein product [Rotaria sp. Silwood1]